MTSLTILATCKQTRFHLLDDNPSAEIDVEGLGIAVTSSTPSIDSSAKSKSKTKTAGRELISDSHLRLKAGVRYGLLGRNGTGKSTLLRAIADKLIPGIPHATRIAILQQTDGGYDTDGLKPDQGVLESVLSSDETRNEVVRTAEDDPLAPVRAIRKIQHQQAEKKLLLAQKNTHLKSGARGLQARKDLIAAEANLASSQALLNHDALDVDAESVQADTQTAAEMLSTVQSQLQDMNIADTKQEARRILHGLGFQDTQDALNQKVSTLSGGWRMRCMLASVLIQTPDIMILDEPTNFLDLLGVVWLENYLQQLPAPSPTLLVVSHDRDFINAVCEETIILRDQTLTYFRGNLAAYEQDVAEQKLYWGRMKEAQERQTAHMEASIRENIKTGKKTQDDNKLRQAKSRQKKVDDRMGVQVNAKGGRFKLNRDLEGYHFTRRAEIQVPTDDKGATMRLPAATPLRFPGPLVSLEKVVFGYKHNTVLDGIDLVVHLGDRVGIMGLNGSGKTTLVRVLAGDVPPSRGKVTTHPRLKVGYYSQHSVEELEARGRNEPALTALELLVAESNGLLDDGAVRGLLSSMGLPGGFASDVPVGKLSGGQLVRLALARIVWSAPQLLILDEVTTHLDFYTVAALVTALSSFDGAILVVSHDRFLVRAVVEGKWHAEHTLDEGFHGLEEEETRELTARRRSVYLLKTGKLSEQRNGVEQFEKSLQRSTEPVLEKLLDGRIRRTSTMPSWA
ncbi:uncharacterized protein L203_104849 [Cryptococcus depauperatus CBS 7841]|uniref:ABC transporter domain-containing protein n=1 Tax=Cryptococcus depauperatus CBS 7841 TaxID=1295531 RepID=A0AAJ8M1Z8_9TREE